MNFFQKAEQEILAIYHKMLTPGNEAIIIGQIALVNKNPDTANKLGDEKHFILASIVAELLSISEAVAHTLVKIVFQRVEEKSPEILKPLEKQIEDAAQASVTSAAAQAEAKLTTNPLAAIATAPAPTSPPTETVAPGADPVGKP